MRDFIMPQFFIFVERFMKKSSSTQNETGTTDAFDAFGLNHDIISAQNKHSRVRGSERWRDNKMRSCLDIILSQHVRSRFMQHNKRVERKAMNYMPFMVNT